MHINPAQLINPAIYELDDRRRKINERFRKTLEKADFLNEEQKNRWKLLSYYMTTDQLEEGEKLIQKHNIKQLRVVHELEKLKSNESKNA